MDALLLLKKDHATVKALFKEANALGERSSAARKKLFDQIDHELSLHARVEEQLLYPALKAKSKRVSEARDEVFEAYEEHALVKHLISELKTLDEKDETYKAKVQVLSELVEHHVKEEESEMFKQARELLGEAELTRMGEQIGAMKAEAPATA